MTDEDTSMKLYRGPHTCANGIHILLEEIGKPYETEKLDVAGKASSKPPFSGINPKGKVPTFVRDDATVLTEFSAIATWLTRTNPGQSLIPTGLDEEARTVEVMCKAPSTARASPASSHPKRSSRRTWSMVPSGWDRGMWSSRAARWSSWALPSSTRNLPGAPMRQGTCAEQIDREQRGRMRPLAMKQQPAANQGRGPLAQHTHRPGAVGRFSKPENEQGEHAAGQHGSDDVEPMRCSNTRVARQRAERQPKGKKPGETLTRNSQGHVVTDRMPDATIEPTARNTAAVNALMPCARPIWLAG